MEERKLVKLNFVGKLRKKKIELVKGFGYWGF